MAKISEVGRSKPQDTPPDHGTNTEYDPLLEGQPVEYIKQCSYMAARAGFEPCGRKALTLPMHHHTPSKTVSCLLSFLFRSFIISVKPNSLSLSGLSKTP